MKLNLKKGLDVDGVLADFSHRIIAHAQEIGEGDHFPATAAEVSSWDMCEKFRPVFNSVRKKDSFWDSIQPLGNWPNFDPEAYITSRPIDSAVTQRWLVEHQFPKRPVFTVNHFSKKLDVLEMLGLDVFIDDYYATVKMINDSSSHVRAILFSAPYQVGHVSEIDGMPIIDVLDNDLIENVYREYFK